MSEYEIYNYGYNILLKEEKEFVFPRYSNNKTYNIFFRGLFDKFGNINKRTILNEDLNCEINICIELNESLKTFLQDFINYLEDLYNITCETNINSKSIVSKVYINFKNYSAINFLNKIYDSSDARYYNYENYTRYINWLINTEKLIPICSFYKTIDEAVTPFKKNVNEIGYNLTIIKLIKKIGHKTYFYDTGIVIIPKFGYYIKTIPKINLIENGYMLINSFVENNNKESVKIVLTKIEESFPDISLPFCCTQIIIEKHVYYTLDELQ